MNSDTLFSLALDLQPPWKVTEITFAPNEYRREELHLTIGFPSGSRFPEESGMLCPVHDTVSASASHQNA